MVSLESGSGARRPTLVFFLFLLVCSCYSGWLAYRSLGVFVGSLRADEIHFLQNAWMAYSGQPALGYIPPLYPFILKFIFQAFSGDLSAVYALRFINFLLFCLQGFLVFKIFSRSFSGLKSRYLPVLLSVLSLSFVTFLSAFRGYEIRPEGLGNTLLLVGLYWLFLNRKLRSPLHYGCYLGVCFAIVVAASLSVRFVLPSFFLWIAVTAQMLYNNEMPAWRGVRAVSFAVVFCLISFVAINYPLVDWGQTFDGMRRYSAGASMDWMTRFTINAWTSYGLFCMLVLGLTGGLGAYVVLASKVEPRVRLANALLFLPLLSYYLFLFVWDINPRGYIHSIEWVLILGVSLFLVKTGIVSGRGSLVSLLIVGSALLFLGQKAMNELSAERNSNYFIERVVRSLESEKMAVRSEPALIEHFDIAAALPEQVESRREFCARHRGSLVISGSILYHPICLVDMGTYDFSGWGSRKVDLLGLPSDQSLIILAADADKLAPLAEHYGDRYKSMPNISIIQKR